MLFDNGFVFDGKRTSDFFTRAERYPSMGAPARKYEAISIPGRNGDLHIVQDAFSNFLQSYDLYFHDKGRSSPALAHDIKSWLMGPKAYTRLEDVYDPDHYRLAVFYGPLEISNALNKYGRCTIQFNCKPQNYLKSGDHPIVMDSPGTIHNPCAYAARPIITVYGSGAGSVSVDGVTIEITEINDSIVLDCDLMTAYSGTKSRNNDIYAPEFPVLASGNSTVDWSGGVTHVEIIPRWWEL